jgi:hypothetical protein
VLKAEEIQVHETPKGKVEIKRKENLTVKFFIGQTDMKERLEARTLMTSRESGLYEKDQERFQIQEQYSYFKNKQTK